MNPVVISHVNNWYPAAYLNIYTIDTEFLVLKPEYYSQTLGQCNGCRYLGSLNRQVSSNNSIGYVDEVVLLFHNGW